MACSSQELPRFLCDPDWSYQQINWSLKKRRVVSLNLVSKKKKNPPTYKETRSPNPLHENQQKDSCENHGNAQAMEKLIPARRVFVIVLRHVVRQAWQSAPPCGGGPLRGNQTLYPNWSAG